MSANPLTEFVKRYYYAPELMVREVFGVSPDPWQVQGLEEYRLALMAGQGRITIRSGHGVGKTTFLAWCIIHFLLTRFPQKTMCTAPTASQLYDALWADVKMWIGLLPSPLLALFEIGAERIALKSAPEASFASVRTSRVEKPDALQGVHSEHVLLIGDEASGIPDAVFEAAAGSMSGDHAITILAGNPVRAEGFFYDTHTRLAHGVGGSESHRWRVLRVNAEESPRVSKTFIAEMKERYGEASNAYRVRVLGEFPVSEDDTLIPRYLIEAAMGRNLPEPDPRTVPMIWGVDVARFGDDKSTLAKRRGPVLVEPVRQWSKVDTMQLSSLILGEWDAAHPVTRPSVILIDEIGMGAGVVDRLMALGLPVRGINVSEAAAMRDTYGNLRAELWYKAQSWFASRACSLPKQEELLNELCAPRYKFSRTGKLLVESKEEMKKRGLSSPNLADALVLTFAEESATIAGYGSALSPGGYRPLKRNVQAVV